MSTDSGQVGWRPLPFALLVFTGMLLVQAAWVLAVPPFRGSDEFDHAYRAAGVASGEWRLTRYADDGRGRVVEVPADLVVAASGQCESLTYTGHDNCHPIASTGAGRVTVATGAGSYNPLYYWIVGKIASPFHGAAALYAMRVSSAILCALFVAAAAWALGTLQPGRWARLSFVAALTPVVLYTTAVAAPNGLEIAAGLLLWCSLLAVTTPRPTPRPLRLGLLAVVMAASVTLITLRLLGPLWWLLVVALVVVLRGPRRIGGVLVRHRRITATGLVLVTTAGVAAVAWAVLSRGYGVPPTDRHDGGSSDVALSTALQLPAWILQMVAAFPYRDQPAPAVVYPLVLLVIATMLGLAIVKSRGSRRLVLSAGVVLSLAVPVVLTLATMAGRGAIWQGRYGLPFTIGILLVAGLALDRLAWAPTEGRRLAVLGLVALVLAQVVSVVQVVRDELGREVSADDSSWVVASPWISGLLMVVGFAVLAVAVIRRHAPS